MVHKFLMPKYSFIIYHGLMIYYWMKNIYNNKNNFFNNLFDIHISI